MLRRASNIKIFTFAIALSLVTGALAAFLDGPFTALRVFAHAITILPPVWFSTLLSARPDATGRCARWMRKHVGSAS